jgi:hypothetical protein
MRAGHAVGELQLINAAGLPVDTFSMTVRDLPGRL